MNAPFKSSRLLAGTVVTIDTYDDNLLGTHRKLATSKSSFPCAEYKSLLIRHILEGAQRGIPWPNCPSQPIEPQFTSLPWWSIDC